MKLNRPDIHMDDMDCAGRLRFDAQPAFEVVLLICSILNQNWSHEDNWIKVQRKKVCDVFPYLKIGLCSSTFRHAL